MFAQQRMAFSPHLEPVFAERVSAPSPFRVDEGYSEEPRSLNGDYYDEDIPMEMDQTSIHILATKQWLLSQSRELRSELARELLLSLPNASISDIVHYANQRLHFDPLLYLPHEIISYIFEFCEPSTLVNASAVSREWRARASDPRLWRRLFRLEGWTYIAENVRCLERNATARKQFLRLRRKSYTRQRTSHGKPPKRDQEGSRYNHSVLSTWPTDCCEGAEENYDNQSKPGLVDEQMQDAPYLEDCSTRTTEGIVCRDDIPSGFLLETQGSFQASSHEAQNRSPFIPQSFSPKLIHNESKCNWQYLYVQRRRLECNWTAGRFSNFRLPHPDHPSEAHSQCVYTIQFTLKHLVSGSRDKSVRVWDLATQRLKYAPLLVHQGSVLCLQFDDRAGQDVIISGGSDADVVVWQFSTGKMIKRMRKAHTESVLNLRFDERYLVTCSKDKTIKVWNRKELRPTDAEYPGTNTSKDAQYPDYIIDVQSGINFSTGPSSLALPLYTLLMTFDGHNAAVNAIQIYENQIVSASGDRKIMLWDIQTGTLVRTFTGHLKGIACVQYDGRRVVSGSSDQTVRIFDSSTAAEVATLDGHRNLVRTVQAEFGDFGGSDDAYEVELRRNDDSIREDRRRHLIRAQSDSWLPIGRVLGAKLPPGGGGNRWSKVVSGSYDETVMIWRRDKEGRWYTAKELRQEDAMRATGPPIARTTQQASTVEIPAWLTSAPPDTTHPQPDRLHTVMLQLSALERLTQQPEYWTNPLPTQTVVEALQDPSLLVASAGPAGALPQGQTQGHHAYAQAVRRQIQKLRYIQQALANGAVPIQPRRQIRITPQQQGQPAPPAANSAIPVPHIPAHLHPHHPHFQHPIPHPNQGLAQNMNQGGPNSRVFKLQFDARRIICCSQEQIIVGWDFANGDQDIIEASQFFGEPR